MKKFFKTTSEPNILLWISFALIVLLLALGVLIVVLPHDWRRILVIVLTSILMAAALAYLVASFFFVGKNKLGETYEQKGNVFKLYFKDRVFRLAINNSLSCIIIMATAFINYIMSFFGVEWYFLSISTIYFVLFIMKLYLIVKISDDQKRQNLFIGILLLFMAIAICGVVVLFVYGSAGSPIAPVMIYWNVFYTVFSISSAISGIVRAFNRRDGVAGRFLSVKLSNAIFSMFTLIVSIPLTFTEGMDNNVKVLCIVIGIFSVITVLAAGISQFVLYHNQKYTFVDASDD